MLKRSYLLRFLFIQCIQISMQACDYQLNHFSTNHLSEIDEARAYLSQYNIWQTLQEDFIKITKEAVAGLQEDPNFVEDLTNPFYENNEAYLKRIFNNKTFEYWEWQRILSNYYIVKREAICKALD